VETYFSVPLHSRPMMGNRAVTWFCRSTPPIPFWYSRAHLGFLTFSLGVWPPFCFGLPCLCYVSWFVFSGEKTKSLSVHLTHKIFLALHVLCSPTFSLFLQISRGMSFLLLLTVPITFVCLSVFYTGLERNTNYLNTICDLRPTVGHTNWALHWYWQED
jgi:hypothetical protein